MARLTKSILRETSSYVTLTELSFGLSAVCVKIERLEIGRGFSRIV